MIAYFARSDKGLCYLLERYSEIAKYISGDNCSGLERGLMLNSSQTL